MEAGCPNISTCKLMIVSDFLEDEQKSNFYTEHYCRAVNSRWEVCNRYVVKEALNFCPDFVLPDSNLTPDEVIEKFDNLL